MLWDARGSLVCLMRGPLVERAPQASIKSYEEMMSAKSKEVEALGSAIEAKTTQIGELGVSIVQMKEDLSDTQARICIREPARVEG